MFSMTRNLVVQAAAVLGLIALLLLAGCSAIQMSTCDNCGNSFQGEGYYDVLRGEDYTLCPDCAESYYAPLPYEQFAK